VRQIWNYMGGYVQDDWRVRPNLTINIGLRYEYTMPIRGGAFTGLKSWEDLSTGKIDGFANFDPTAPNPGAGNLPGAMVYSGSGTGRLRTNDTWTLDLQKELTPSMSLTVGHSGQKGTHIASALDRFNQIPMSLLDKYGFTLLNSSINSPAARAANIPIPYAGFGNLS